MKEKLYEIISEITELDAAAMEKARERQSMLAKPPGSLGRLEDISIQIAGITGKVINKIEKKRVIVLAADNGVVAEGVSSAPQYVTLAQTINMTRGKTGMSVLAKHFDNEIVVVDVGVNANVKCADVIGRKIAMGTQNIAHAPAMSYDEALKAIHIGIELVRSSKEDLVDIIGVGEMGIGNTTTSSAVLSALTGLPAEKTTGRGGGITDESFLRKKRVIDAALKMHEPDSADVVDVLAKVGGFDLAAMTGVFLGAAYYRIPAVIDGFISIVAALCAVRLCPEISGFLISSHESYERGYIVASEQLKLHPCLLLDMRLGEGSGCPLAFEIVSAACAVLENMATFEEAEINDEYLEEIRENDSFTV